MDWNLDEAWIAGVRRRVEERILTVLEEVYGEEARLDAGEPYDPARVLPPDFRPAHKPIERTVGYFDYAATGISVLAPLARAGNARAREIVERILRNSRYYVERVWLHYRREDEGGALWDTPLRRLLLHLGLAWPHLEAMLGRGELEKLRTLLASQVEAAYRHYSGFWPGARGWIFCAANNHTAIFAQGIHRLGLALERRDWVADMVDFAGRWLDEMHPDGYFDENCKMERIDGPSLVYTPLTAGSLFDVLDGRERRQREFLKAGRFLRSFVNDAYGLIPLADERTNYDHALHSYGLALHTLTPEGRGFVRGVLDTTDSVAGADAQGLAVLHHELGLMTPGEGAVPENLREGDVRIAMPIGIVRRGGWTAGLCGLRATIREFRSESDYALDQQAHVYLAHRGLGVLLPATKGKNNPLLSTCRQGADAYTRATGELRMAADGASVTVHYHDFDVRIAWDLTGGAARLRFESDSDRPIVTTLPVRGAAEKCLRTEAPWQVRDVAGFSPYTAGNAAEAVRCAVFEWREKLEMAFEA